MAQATRSINKLTPEVRRQINQYRKLLVDANIPVSQIIVFGSQAKGKTHSGSDIDLAVVSPSFDKDHFDALGRLMRVRDDDTIDIEPHPLHPDDLNDRWSTFAQEIKRHGIRV